MSIRSLLDAPDRRRYLLAGSLAASLMLGPAFAAHPAPSTAPAPSLLEGPAPGTETVFPQSQDLVEVPFRIFLNKILIPVSVNGVGPFDFVLDTGASAPLFHAPTPPADLKLEIIGSTPIQGAGGGSGQTIEVAGSVTFGIGGLEIRGAQMAVARPESSISQRMGSLWQGILGRQLFESTVVEIDWMSETLRLHRPETFRPAPGDAVLDLDFEHGHTFVGARLALDDEPPRPVRLVIDSGAFHALALGGNQRPARYLDDVMLGRGLNGEIRGGVGRIRQLELGPFAFQDVVTSFPGAEMTSIITSGSDGNLGSEILRRFVVTFDYTGKRLLLRPNRRFAEPFDFSTSGIWPRSHPDPDGRLAIDDVFPGSPAALAGLTESDRLTAIDGQPIDTLSIPTVRALLQGPPGTELHLEVERDGQQREVSIQLRPLLG